MQVIRVSGTIRKAEEEVIRRARTAILNARRGSNSGSSDLLDKILGADRREIPEHYENVTGIEDQDDDDDDDNQDQDSTDRG